MRRNLHIFPLLCTLLLVVTGAALPRITALGLDSRLLKETTRWEDPHVTLVLSRELDFFQTLALFAAPQSQIDLTEGRVMTAQQARDAAVEILEELGAAGMVYTDPSVTPVLIADKEDPGLSGVFWRCVWTGDDGKQETLWLDDGSGQMAALQARVGLPTVYAKSQEEFQEPALALAEFCRKYYPVDEVKLALNPVSEAYSDYTLVLLKGGEDSGGTCSIPLRLRGGWLYFNL